MYQKLSDLSSSEIVGVDGSKLPPHEDFESLETDNQVLSTSIAVDSSTAKSSHVKSSDAHKLSSGELILCLIAVALLVSVLAWYLENIGDRFERFRSRLRGWRISTDDEQTDKRTKEFKIAKFESTPSVDEVSGNKLEDGGESAELLNQNASLESVGVESVDRLEEIESEQVVQRQELNDVSEDKYGNDFVDSSVLESQSIEIESLKQELAARANELETLKQNFDEENEVALADAETRYQNLADELAASKLDKSQIEIELSTANQSLESLAAEKLQAEQELKTAFEQLCEKEDSVGQLESNLVSSQSLAESLEASLMLAQSDLQNQVQQAGTTESKIEAFENEALQLKQQLSELREQHREDEMSREGAVESLSAKLATRTAELDELRNRFEETTTSRDEKTALLEEADVRCKNLNEELEELKLSETQNQTQLQSEFETAQKEILTLKENAEHAKEEIDAFYQEMQNKDDIATALGEENEQLRSTMENVENQLATVETDAKLTLESKEEMRAQFKEQIDCLEQLKQQHQSELTSAKQEISKLQQNTEFSQSDFDQKLSEHAEMIEDLESRLEATTIEAQTSLVENKKLNSIITNAESELASAQAEIKDLKSLIAENDVSAEQTEVLQKQLEEVNAQAGDSLKQIDLLTFEIDELKNQLRLTTEELDVATTSLAKHDDQLAQLNAKSKLLEERAEGAELKLAETSASLVQQQNDYAELETASKQGRDELNLQAAKYSEAESELASAQAEITDLKSLIAENDVSAEQTEVLQKQIEEVNAQAGDSLKQIDLLTFEIDELKNQLRLTTEELDVATTSHAKHDDQLAQLNAKSKLLEERAEGAELKLAETSATLVQQQNDYAELETASKQHRDELNLQAAKYSEAESELASAQAEITDLKSLLAENDMSAEQTEVLQKQLQEINAQAGDSLKQIDLLTFEIDELKNQLRLTTEELDVATTSHAKHDDQLAQLNTESKSLKERTEGAELKLAETSAMFLQQQNDYTEMETASKQHRDELALQVAKYSELETNAASLENQIQASGEKTEQMAAELREARLLQVELEKTTKRQKAKLSQKENLCKELESKLQKTVEALDDKGSSDFQNLADQSDEREELQIALQNEETQRLEILEELKISQSRIAELEQQCQANSENEPNYEKMANKAIKYKSAYKKMEAYLKELTEQKSDMMELATEYLAVAKILRRDLDIQLNITAELERKLKERSSSGENSPDLKLLVQKSARAHVLAMKTEFEERIKKKNAKIRKLKNREPVQS